MSQFESPFGNQFEKIKIEKNEVRGSVVISLNRPELRNSFEPAMIEEITRAFVQIAKDSTVRVIILKGEGKSFSSGADLNYMKSMADFSLEENQADSEKLFEMFNAIRNCPIPVIGRLHGHVMGGALGLAAVCDIAAAVDGTKFCFSEVKLGLAPAVISPFVLEKMTSSHARRYMLTAEVFESTVAREAQLVQFVGSESEVDLFVEDLAKTLCANGPEATRATKHLIRTFFETTDWSVRKQKTTSVIAERRVSSEGQEGLKSFFEKREPTWRK